MTQPNVLSNPAVAQHLAVATAKSLTRLRAAAGVIGIDSIMSEPQVQMKDLVSLKNIVGGAPVKMERSERYTRYSIVVDGVCFFFLSVKRPEIQ